METWKAVVEFPDHYEISSNGRLRSKDRKTPYITRHGTPSIRRQAGRILKEKKCHSGYIYYCLTVNGDYFYRKGHSMVLEAFVGPRPSSDHQADHIDFNRANNEVDNLQWLTSIENTRRSMPNRPDRHKYQRTVALTDQHGICFIFPSMESAGRALGRSSASLSSAIRKDNKCRGFSVNCIHSGV